MSPGKRDPNWNVDAELAKAGQIFVLTKQPYTGTGDPTGVPLPENTEILPCPFCGGAVKHYYGGSSDWVFECSSPANECGMSLTFWVQGRDEPTRARQMWNRRTPPPQSPPQAATGSGHNSNCHRCGLPMAMHGEENNRCGNPGGDILIPNKAFNPLCPKCGSGTPGTHWPPCPPPCHALQLRPR